MSSVNDNGGPASSAPAGEPGDSRESGESRESSESSEPSESSESSEPRESSVADRSGESTPGPEREHHGEGEGERVGVGAPPAYTPPSSPAYAEPARPTIRYVRLASEQAADRAPAQESTAADQPDPPAAADRSARRGRQLLVLGSMLVVAATGTAAAIVLTGGAEDDYTFGQIGDVRGEPVVRVDEAADETLPLAVGDTVRAGWNVELPDGASVTVELDGGGLARFDSGARLAFVDGGAAPDTGQPDGDSGPAIEISTGRMWISPGSANASDIEVHLLAGVVESAGNPLAVDCAVACTVEAPAGGVALTTTTGAEMAPAANEVVTLEPPDAVEVSFAAGPSPWAQQNLDADAAAGLPAPRPDEGTGIRDSAILDGAYQISIDVVGAPMGEAIPDALRYGSGESYAVSLTADGSACTSGTCTVPVTAPDGVTGTAELADGSVTLTLSQPIDCYDDTYTTVVVHDIGTTTVEAVMGVSDVVHDGDRWLVGTFDGEGTVAAALSTPCNPGDILGTSTSQVAIVGS